MGHLRSRRWRLLGAVAAIGIGIVGVVDLGSLVEAQAPPLAAASENGVTLSVTGVQFSPWDTVVQCSVTNASGIPLQMADAEATLTQGSGQLAAFYSAPDSTQDFPDPLANGVTATAQLVFAPANPNGPPLQLSFPVLTNSMTLNDWTFSLTVPTPAINYPQPVPAIQVVENRTVGGSIEALPSGADPAQTTLAIAAEEGLNAPSSVVLASGDPSHLIDALTAGPLAYVHHAPLLLTPDSTSLGPDLGAYLRSPSIHTIYLVGVLGGADFPTMQAQIQSLNPAAVLVSVSGADRFQTALAIAQQMPPSNAIFVASGAPGHLVDAVAASPAAARLGAPILLESPTEGVPTTATKGVQTTYLVGAAAGPDYWIVNQLLPGPFVTLAGATRNQTAIAIAQAFFPNARRIILTSGDDDHLRWALAAGPLASALGVPIALVESGAPNTVARQALDASSPAQILLGGYAAQDPNALQYAKAALL